MGKTMDEQSSLGRLTEIISMLPPDAAAELSDTFMDRSPEVVGALFKLALWSGAIGGLSNIRDEAVLVAFTGMVDEDRAAPNERAIDLLVESGWAFRVMSNDGKLMGIE